MEPILKWAGGKRQLLNDLLDLITIEENATFYEPFVGGGSVFMALEHSHVVINDCNEELINVYKQIKLHPKKIIKLLEGHKCNHSRDYYYEIRDLQRCNKYNELNGIERAARTIYLNRTCFNGLYRVNAKGYFNVPIGNYKNPDIIQSERILMLSKYLNENDISIICGDFRNAVLTAKKGDVIYFDPPYDYEADGFTKYTVNKFSREDLRELKLLCDDLINRGCHVIVSNNYTSFVNEVFDNSYNKKEVLAKRMINCDGKNRTNVVELIIYK